jgi:molecular chaperone GrpE
MKKENNIHKELDKTKEKIEELKEEKKECENEKNNILLELDEYKKKAEDYYDQLLRLKAEFENYRKRVEKEKIELVKWGKYDFMQSILPLYEMMNMAKKHIENSSSHKDIKYGLDMIFAEFDKVFKNHGLTEIDVFNKKYDPMLCEIVATVDGDDEGKVVEVISPGYMVDGRILRPAKVKVIKKATQNNTKTSENVSENTTNDLDNDKDLNNQVS